MTYKFATVEDFPRQPIVRFFRRCWDGRHDEPVLLPNGRDYTDPRGSLRDNIRGQRSIRRYLATEAGDARDWSHYPGLIGG